MTIRRQRVERLLTRMLALLALLTALLVLLLALIEPFTGDMLYADIRSLNQQYSATLAGR